MQQDSRGEQPAEIWMYHLDSKVPFFDVFLSHSSGDSPWVERLAEMLENRHGLHVWLDKWNLVPGQSFQQSIARGLDQTRSCAVCIGQRTLTGWFQQEVERALNRQAKDSSFRVIPVLLPDAKLKNVDNFLELRTWVDFRTADFEEAFYRLACGIKGIPPGRGPH